MGQNGQIPTGTWRSHFSYFNTSTAESSSDYIYAGSNESFFRFDIDNRENQRLTKDDGFSGSSKGESNWEKEFEVLKNTKSTKNEEWNNNFDEPPKVQKSTTSYARLDK